MVQDPDPEIYQVHVWIRQISPMIWRRLLLHSDSTLADLHYAIQIAFGWTDFHLHHFRLRSKDYGIPRVGGPWYSQDARKVELSELTFRCNERFLYEYDFGDLWQHEVRIEKRQSVERRRIYSVCIGGRRAGPPEDCSGPWAFMARRDKVPWEVEELMGELVEEVEAGDREAVEDGLDRLRSLREWLALKTFNRRRVNRRLKQYALGEEGGSGSRGSGL
jgi:hypothetical protein